MQSRLEQLMHRRVMYTVTDQDGICVLYDTGILATVEEETETKAPTYIYV